MAPPGNGSTPQPSPVSSFDRVRFRLLLCLQSLKHACFLVAVTVIAASLVFFNLGYVMVRNLTYLGFV